MNNPLSKQEFLTTLDAVIERLMNSRDLSVDNIAREFGWQSQQMRRRIKAITGVCSTEYIANYKVMRAKQMLEKYDLQQIAKVGYLCGFEEPTHFTRFFKQHTGMTPGEYRRKTASQPPQEEV